MAYVYKVQIGSTSYPVASSLHGTSSTASSTAAKAVTLSTFDAYQSGILLSVKFSNAQTADAALTLNVNSKGAKNIYVNGSATSTSNPLHWGANATLLFLYDGTQFHAIGNDTNTDELVKQNQKTDNNWYPLLLTGDYGPISGEDNSANYSTNAKLNPSTGNLLVGKVGTDGTNYYEIGAAAEKGVSTTVSANDSNLVTGGAVATAIEQAATGGVAYKGAINNSSGNTDYWQTKMLNTALTAGWYYMATADFSIDTQDIEVGDMIFVNTAGTYTTAAQLAAAIDVIQGELDAMTTSDIDDAVSDAS